MADVFVSYSRRDSAYVQRLVAALEDRGKDVWVDVEGIRDGEVFPAALRNAIEGSDAFLFVISPDSVHSSFCEQEVGRAVELNKRVLPLALREVPDDEIPGEIRFRNWIPAGHDGEFDISVERLVKALDTDLDWEHQHTRLIVKALEWDQSGRDRNLSLRGSELAAAEQWLAAGAGKDPGPTELEREYLLAGRAAATRRQRRLMGISLGIAAVSIALVIFALISRSQAIGARNSAKKQATTARSRALAADSQTQLAIDPERSVLLAGDAVRTAPTPEALFALRAAVDASPIRFRLPDVGPQNCGDFFTQVPGVAFSPNGLRLAEGTCQGTVVLADARTGRVTRRVRVGGQSGAVAYNRDGSLLAAAAGQRVVLLDPSTGAIDRTGPPIGGARRILFSPTAPLLAITGNGDLALWNVRTGHTRTVHFGGVGQRLGPTAGLAFSPDGKRLAVTLQTEQANGILVLDAASGRTIATSGHPFGSTSGLNTDQMSFSPDGKQLAAAQTAANGDVGMFVVLDSRTLAPRRTLTRLSAVEASAVAFSPDGKTVAFGGADGTAGLVSAQTGQSILSYQGHTAVVSKVAFSPDGRLVATASQDGTVRVWSGFAAGLPTASFGGSISNVRAAGSGFVALGSQHGHVVVQTWPTIGAPPGAPLELSPTTNVNAEFISDDGRLAGIIRLPGGGSASGPPTAPIRVWDIPGRRVVANVPASTAPFGGEPTFSPDGTTMAMGKLVAPAALIGPGARPGQPVTPGISLVLVDVRTGKNRALGTTPCGAGWRSQPFSRDGRLVAGGTFCGQVDIWNVATGRRVGHEFSIGGELAWLAFSPDGKRIAAASWNSTITVADVSTGRVVAVLTDHTRGVPALDYSPDGRYLASASLDGTARIWDARTMRLLRILHHPGPVFGVVFTPNSSAVVTDDAKVMRVWDACTACGDQRALLDIARTRVTRRLTRQERVTFGEAP